MDNSGLILGADFFERDSRLVAQELVGAELVHMDNNGLLRTGRIVETEAYRADDPACHAYGLARQSETRAGFLFEAPGLAYVYLCFGVHWLLNVVTEPKGVVGAVLIRAIEPISGLECMQESRNYPKRPQDLSNGPGKLTQALGIDGNMHGMDMTKAPLYIKHHNTKRRIKATPRVGISQGRDLRWRYIDTDSKYITPAKENLL